MYDPDNASLKSREYPAMAEYVVKTSDGRSAVIQATCSTTIYDILLHVSASLGLTDEHGGIETMVRCGPRVMRMDESLEEAGLLTGCSLEVESGRHAGMPNSSAHNSYGDSYTNLLLLHIRSGTDTDVVRANEAAEQEETFTKLKAVLAARLSPSQSSIEFDPKIDDTELLLRQFWELDQDHDGAVSKEELFGSPLLQKPENAEMAKIFQRSWMCDLAVVDDALAHLDESDFGAFRRTTATPDNAFDRAASVREVFEKASVQTFTRIRSTGSSSATASSAAMLELMVTRTGLDGLLTRNFSAQQVSGSGVQAEGKLELALKALAQELLPDDKDLDFLAFKKVMRRLPRVAGQRIEWVNEMGIAASLARHLPPGTFEDGLDGIKRLDDASADQALDAFCADLKRTFKAYLVETKQDQGSTSAMAANSKFEGFQGSFASLKDFHAGAEATLQLGYPNPDIEKGIRTEHTAHISTKKLFVTPNYSIATCLVIEYWWAIYEENPTDKVVIGLRDEAVRLIKKLHSDRGDIGIRSDASISGDARIIFPGESGDSFVESLVLVKIKAESKKCMKAVQQAAEKLLDTEEEKARSYRTIDQAACLSWMATRSSIRRQLAPASVQGEAGVCMVGVVLPMSKARAGAKCAVLQTEVAGAFPQDVAASVVVTLMSDKELAFSDRPDIDELKKHMAELSLFELKTWARTIWGIPDSASNPTRELIGARIIDSFVQTELQGDFRSALANAEDSELNAVLQDWSPTSNSGASRQERIDMLCQSLITEARWKEVESWVRLFIARIQGRTRLGLKGLMQREKKKIKKFELVAAEVLALYIYTGPEFVPINAICRNFPQNVLDLLRGDATTPRNTLCTTLFCITSGIKKLGRYTDLPEDRKVYRGLGRMLLPPQFWVPHGTPAWRGGVERAFMSTTADKRVAVFYANGRGTVVEIHVGRIQIGGDVSFLSMVSRAYCASRGRTHSLP